MTDKASNAAQSARESCQEVQPSVLLFTTSLQLQMNITKCFSSQVSGKMFSYQPSLV